MHRLTIARSLLLALVGLTLALALVAALEVASLYSARQDYEDDLARSYAGEVSAANLLAAGVVEETVLRATNADAAARRRAVTAFDSAVAAARGAARGDARSLASVDSAEAAQLQVRRIAGRKKPQATPAG